MADAADVACCHMVSGLTADDPTQTNATGEVRWVCHDCGQVFARLALDAALIPGQLEVWAARAGVPDRQVARLLRAMAADAAVPA